MKKLPKTWYVTVTKENQRVLTWWRFEDGVSQLPIGAVTGIYENGGKGWDYKFQKGWKNEITFEQFRKLVLLEDVEPQYEIY